ncbi:EF-hand domain-containing protein [Fodinicola feengrottensis]|uniref:EF-hand domain-containing protein n=1 Tax=Fodinicola feengrottensis TaxID=435914 RepID=A0ABP4RZ92_9ACTN|nr:EF-hand domain-containing protein [Fodinicola feengrottensis]
MASDFQRGKVAGVFAAMDEDSRGFLIERDFASLAQRWTTLRGLEPGTDQYERLREIMLGWWASLRTAAGGRDRVTLDDVMALVDQLPTMVDAVTGTADAMFEAIDENSDGELSPAEYRQLITAWTGQDANVDEIFPLLDLNSDGHISLDEFRRLWTQFWAGDDPAAPGTWVFGRYRVG